MLRAFMARSLGEAAEAKTNNQQMRQGTRKSASAAGIASNKPNSDESRIAQQISVCIYAPLLLNVQARNRK